MSTTRFELGIIAGVVLAAMLLNLFYMAYLIRFKLEKAEIHLVNSAWILNNRKMLLHSGWVGAIYRLNAIAIVLTMPVLSAKRELGSLPEILAFPKKLKTLILTNYCFLILSTCALAAVVIVSKTSLSPTP
ncbi:hypothetical protein [Pseudomonas sp. UM16]|uniref:hypothetical protein n=1 Tax=Pseudomonas sp. UM16 TaxID=3158962 RepID=UPI00398FC2E5